MIFPQRLGNLEAAVAEVFRRILSFVILHVYTLLIEYDCH